MKEIKGDYDEIVNKMLDEISSGKRIDYALVNHVPITEINVNVEYFLAYAIDWFMVRHNMTRKKATSTILNNIRYIVGHYGKETQEAWYKEIARYE